MDLRTFSLIYVEYVSHFRVLRVLQCFARDNFVPNFVCAMHSIQIRIERSRKCLPVVLGNLLPKYIYVFLILRPVWVNRQLLPFPTPKPEPYNTNTRAQHLALRHLYSFPVFQTAYVKKFMYFLGKTLLETHTNTVGVVLVLRVSVSSLANTVPNFCRMRVASTTDSNPARVQFLFFFFVLCTATYFRVCVY